MNNIPWAMLLDIRLTSVCILLVCVSAIGILEDLVQRKVLPKPMDPILAMLPFALLLTFLFTMAVFDTRIITINIVEAFCGIACLPMGLVYAGRSVQVGDTDYSRLGRVFSFMIVGCMVWFFLLCLEAWLADAFAGFYIPGLLKLMMYVAAIVATELTMRKLELPAIRRLRYKDFQCMD